jgi:hypothetical protein
MCVVESGRVLETVPKQAIHADMGSPDQPVGKQPELFVKDRDCDEQQRKDKGMDQII